MRLSVSRTLAITLLLLAGGCSRARPVDSPDGRIQKLARLYLQAVAAAGGAAGSGTITDEAQFRRAVGELDKEQLAAFDVRADEVDQLFVSPRDRQPYLVAYRIDPSSRDAATRIIVAEATGQNGQKWVVYGDLRVEEVDAATVPGDLSAPKRGR